MTMAAVDPASVDRILNSAAFRDLERAVETNNARWRDLRPDQRRKAMILYLGGEGDVTPNFWRLLYKRRVPPIGEFMSSRYIPVSVYAQWRRDLGVIFAPGSVIDQFAIGGSIGTGKSTVSRVAMHYLDFHANSLHEPQRFMGSAPGTPMGVKLIAPDLTKSNKVLLGPYENMLETSPFYVRVDKEEHLVLYERESRGEITPFCTKRLTNGSKQIQFPNDIFVGIGSTTGHAIGEDLFGAVFDEAEFRIGGDPEAALRLYQQLFERIRSRFMNRRPTLAIMASSAGTESGVVARHMDDVREDPTTYIAEYTIWDVKFPGLMAQGHFHVLRGTRTHPSRILDAEKGAIDAGTWTPPGGTEVVRVPTRYRRNFENHLEDSLRNLAGVRTVQDDTPFDDLSGIEDLRLVPELSLSVPVVCPLPIWRMIPRSFVRETPDGFVPARYPNAPRYVHCDLAETGEAGIAVCHKELDGEGGIKLVFDLVLRITTTDRIDYDRCTEFVLDLKRVFNMHVHTLSTDQYQSLAMRMRAEADKAAVNVKRVSVDATAEAYLLLSSGVVQRNVKTGAAPYLLAQLAKVRVRNNKPFCDGRKDVADAVCGAAFNAVSNAHDIPSVRYLDDAFARAVEVRLKDEEGEEFEEV